MRLHYVIFLRMAKKMIESGVIKVIGKAEDGSVLLDDSDYEKEFVPGNQWWIPSHDCN